MPLEVREVYAGYQEDIFILQGVSLSATDGRITAVLGGNGVGKSTLLRTVAGFLTPARGRIAWNGRDLVGVEPHRLAALQIAFIPQGHSLFPYLTVEENLALGCWSFRGDGRRVRRAMARVLERLPVLRDLLRRQAGDMSGGQQRLLELGRALLIEPQLLLVDEPTAGLAPLLTEEVYRILCSLRDQDRITTLLADQNVRRALEAADYVYVLEQGRNRLEGPREEFADLMMDRVERWLL